VATTQLPQLDVVGWRNQIRSIWQSDPGLTTAKITWAILYLQRSYLEDLRKTVTIHHLVDALRNWDQLFAQYSSRLSRYREEILLAGEQDDPLTVLVPYYADPVFEGRYGAIVAAGDIAWPNFIQPSMADAMVGASLFNQLYSVLVLSDELERDTRILLGTCVLPPPANLGCHVGIGRLHSEFITKASEQIERLGAAVTDKTKEAIEAARNAAEDLGRWVQRTAQAVGEGVSTFVKVAGVILISGIAIYTLNEALDLGLGGRKA
jgi:hypothetical protein